MGFKCYSKPEIGREKVKGMAEKNIAIVLAAGRGSRMGTDVPKQFLKIDGKPVLYYSLKVFQENPYIDEIVLVIGKEYQEYCYEQIVGRYGLTKVTTMVSGGAERYHSVYEGLKACSDCKYVFIHDGARPFVTDAIIERCIETVRANDACVVGMPVKDTIKIADEDGYISSTPPRNKVWMVQTPQVFSYPLIRNAYEKMLCSNMAGITDDAMVAEAFSNQKVRLVEGSYENIKITTPEDIKIAENFLKNVVDKIN